MNTTLQDLLLPVHAASTLAMVGIIWMVQLVHYPLMASVGRDAFDAYHAQHLRRMTWVVGPFMLAESATAVALLEYGPVRMPESWAWIGVALLMVNWIATAVLSIPCHRRLERGWDERAHRRLVATNWLRTFAWSARGVLALCMMRYAS